MNKTRVAAIAICMSAIAVLNAQTLPQQRPPVFRSDANLVQVDVYPMKDGRIVTNLEKSDFELFEDGKPQKVESFDLVKLENYTPDGNKRDPNTIAESLELAADPKNRVFVVYLDTPHVSIEGSHDARLPLVKFLNRVMTDTDLFGVITAEMRPRDLTLGRRALTTEDTLARNWPWGMRATIKRTPEENDLNACTIDPKTGKEKTVHVGAIDRLMIDELIDRHREDRVLTHLENVVDYLGSIRETRTSLIVFTEGWLLFEENRALAAGLDQMADIPSIGLGPAGQMRIGSGANAGSRASCVSEVQRLATLSDHGRFRDLVERAKRANVVFYPVNPAGLGTFDMPINQAFTSNGAGSVLLQDHQQLTSRADAMIDVARNTGGLAVVNTNDINAGLDRIANQLSAYYVLSYYSTNAKFDGKYRRIEVKLKVPGVSVTARNGYRAPTDAEMAARSAPKSTVAPAIEAAANENGAALGTLSKIRPSTDLYGWGAQTSASEVTVVAEVSTQLAEAGKWNEGADFQVVLTTAAGEMAGSGRGRLDQFSRGATARVPVPAGTKGPWSAQLRLRSGADLLETTTSVAASPPASGTTLLSDPLLYRAGPGLQSALHPAADQMFRRTERVHIEWLTGAPLETREAKLLDRAGNALPVQVTLGEKTGALVADVNLAPLGPGDYIIELTVSGGGNTAHTKIAIRVGA